MTTPVSIIPTHQVASWLLKSIDAVLDHLGLAHRQTLEEVIYFVMIAVFSLTVGLVLKRLILLVTQKAVRLRNTLAGQQLLQEKTFTKCAHIIPPLVFMALIPFAFDSSSQVLTWIMRAVGVYALCAFGVGMGAIFTFIFNRYDARRNSKNLPLRGVLNIAIGALWIIIVIVAVSIMVNRSPGALLAGLGAFAAALMLIFKDSILGFVAGIQMSDNDMLRVGDWIVVPDTPANGTVIDVSLSTVKVQNFDLTIVTVPPYTLVSGSFQNYRGMTDSGARRINDTLIIDITTIQGLTDALLERVTNKFPVIQKFVDTLKADKTMVAENAGTRPVNGTLETNLGLFRAYVCEYLLNNSGISKEQRILVRLLDPTEQGVPLQMWCFTNTTDWNQYESIRSAVLEHLAAVIGDFGLSIYSSSSLTLSGALSTKQA